MFNQSYLKQYQQHQGVYKADSRYNCGELIFSLFDLTIQTLISIKDAIDSNRINDRNKLVNKFFDQVQLGFIAGLDFSVNNELCMALLDFYNKSMNRILKSCYYQDSKECVNVATEFLELKKTFALC